MKWPASVLVVGVLLIATGTLLDGYVGQGAALAVALLLGAGGLCSLLGVSGLLSALVVHIVKRRDR
ncbi:MAG: hypothetical protein KKA32_00785 [Actinobacteria bacterium]|nr:hypothetical protein [Actinomycetota bacterium]